MIGISRAPLLALLSCVMIVTAGSLASAIDTLDTSALPRLDGAKPIYASPPTTSFTVPASVAQAGDATLGMLMAAGWQPYGAPFSASANMPSLRIMSFKKGPQALSVFITLAPAQGNATSVSYTAVLLAHDLPFPADARKIAFDPERPHLECSTAAPVSAALAFFHKELATLGWQGEGRDMASDKGGRAFFVRAGERPLMLTLQRDGDDTKVTLKAISPEQLRATQQVADSAGAPAMAQPQPAAAGRAQAPQPSSADADAVVDDVSKAIREALNDALKETRRPAAAPAPAANSEVLRVASTSPAPVPLPEKADEVDFDGDRGRLEFRSDASVAALAAFYRSSMAPLGWKEKRSVINRANMVVLDFRRGNAAVSFTIMQLGPSVKVDATGSGLVVAAAKPEIRPATKAEVAETATPAATPASADDLLPEEMSGLPVPKRRTQSVGEKAKYRRTLTVSTPLDLQSVLAFYRRELSKREWREETKGAAIKADEVRLTFATPDGPALLKLGRKDGETTVSLVLRQPEAARKDGMLPKASQAKLMFANMLPTDAVITINKQVVKVAAGVGTKAPTGPSLDMPPGKYSVSLKIAGQPAQTDQVEIGADETWGVLVGPGGVLPLQVY